MKQSEFFVKTLKKAPKDAVSANQIFLTRGGFVHQLMSGVYALMPLGYLVFKKIENLIREELKSAGALEVSLPILHPADIWKKTGRWHEIGKELWRIKNREGADFALSMTHEEAMAEMVSHFISRAGDMPLLLNQFQIKIRDEERPRGGLIRLREFVMQDAYSFDIGEKELDKTYKKVFLAYERIFKKLGLKAVPVKADPGIMGGSESHEFMAASDAGEDRLNGKKAIELGHTFKLGLKYSKPFNIHFKDRHQKEKPVVMGSYGIGLERLMAAIVETSHDEKGIIWPESAAPFQFHLIEINGGKSVKNYAEKIYENLLAKGAEVLYDNRDDKTPGEKFAEADLIGIPTRLVVSERTLLKDAVEVKKRNQKESKTVNFREI